VEDPELSPLDLTVAPNGNVVVSSERPFGALDAVTTVREYDPGSGRLVRVLSASDVAEFRRPRGLRFGAAVISTAPLRTRCRVRLHEWSLSQRHRPIDPAEWAGPRLFSTVGPSLTCED
jgi:hypothetical protein